MDNGCIQRTRQYCLQITMRAIVSIISKYDFMLAHTLAQMVTGDIRTVLTLTSMRDFNKSNSQQPLM